ncbi:MAG: SusC/RagA family TonB-linked outer membrane protein [Bacteroidaceae bacterium]|nr:SusC/RagA family TonB-linked outer membrane protein [Bacteroidaceae bacterium]
MIKIKQLFLVALCCMLGISAYAQKSARISGNVFSKSEGPLMMVNITERNSDDRIIEATMTDMEGNFSMVVKNTSNHLEISYIGYKTQKLQIGSRTVFNVEMIEDNMIDEVVITAKPRSRNGALEILDREISSATQKVSMSDMEGLSFASVDEALQGQIAGLDVVFSSGDLGSGTQMRLRGTSNITGNAEPLIVVNDNIFEMPADEGSSFDFDNLNNEQFSELLSVNPDDIESIEVLKDAASCAIWGSRGANGVIKIKTKRGRRGPTRVSFSMKFKDKWIPKGMNLLNGDEYTMLLKESHFNPQQQATSIPEINYDPNFDQYENFNENTDWVDAVTKHGYRNEYSVNLNGGGEKATFRISGAFTNETGTIINQYLETFSSRMALDYYVSDRIKVMTEFAFSYTNNKKNYDDLLSTAQKIMPNMSIWYQDRYGNNTPDYYKMLINSSSTFHGDQRSFRNPVASGNLAKSNQESYSVSPQITLEYNLLGLEDDESQLKYRGLVYMNAATLSNSSYLPSALVNSDWTGSSVNTASVYDSKSLQFTTRHQLVFTPYLGNSDHYLTMSGQFEVNMSNSTTQSQSTYGLPNGFNSTTIGSYLSGASTSKGQSRSLNFTYQAHYSYKSKYVLGLAVRGEGHTQFGDDRKWTVFPSLSGRWNVSDEPWMEWAKPVLSMFSLRPSYGWAGNTPGQEYLMYTSYTPQGNYLGITGFVPGGIRMSDLRASDKREFNIGSDFGLFDDKISGSLNYYVSTTKDQLMSNYSIPTSTGYNSLAYKNTGAVENTGWELNLNVNRLKVFKDFTFSAYFNVGQNFNEVTEMEHSVLKNNNPDYDFNNGSYLGRIQIGNPLASIYGFRYKGVYRYSYKNWEKALSEEAAGRNGTCPIVRDADGNVVFNADGTPKRMVFNYDIETGTAAYEFNGGDAIYEDINHDGNINELDLVYLGNSNPKAQGGFGFTFQYKRFTLKSNFSYRWDVDVINSARMDVENMHGNYNQSKAVNWRWRKDGDITVIPRALKGTGYNYLGSDRYVEDASYLRLSYLQASYSFDRKWLEKYGLQSLTLYASADNICAWSKYTGLDPEVSAGAWGRAYDSSKTPRSRSYTISVSVGF